MSDLDPRKQTILRAVVIEYVTSAEPIASETLVQKYELGVRSATVRNELAEMAEMGYLEQPHTSAGRVPSDRGYRYYVDRLFESRELERETKQQVRGVADEGEALQSLLRETTRVLSRLTHLLTAAAIVRDSAVTVRNLVVSALGPQQALMVVVLSNGHVENRMIECPVGLTLQDVGAVNELLAGAASGKTLRALSRAKPPTSPGQPAADQMVALAWQALRGIARELTRGNLIVEGEEFLFGQPEFQRNVQALTTLLDSLQDSGALYEALSAPGESSQTVKIGRENRHEQLHQLSIVRQSFFVGENEAGAIAIIGPTRMAYDSSIPLVNYTAKALSESLTRFFG